MKEETRTGIQVSVESLRDEIRVVADGVLMNGRRIDSLTVRVDVLTHRVGTLENTVSSGLASHEARIRALGVAPHPNSPSTTTSITPMTAPSR